MQPLTSSNPSNRRWARSIHVIEKRRPQNRLARVPVHLPDEQNSEEGVEQLADGGGAGPGQHGRIPSASCRRYGSPACAGMAESSMPTSCARPMHTQFGCHAAMPMSCRTACGAHRTSRSDSRTKSTPPACPTAAAWWQQSTQTPWPGHYSRWGNVYCSPYVMEKDRSSENGIKKTQRSVERTQSLGNMYIYVYGCHNHDEVLHFQLSTLSNKDTSSHQILP